MKKGFRPQRKQRDTEFAPCKYETDYTSCEMKAEKQLFYVKPIIRILTALPSTSPEKLATNKHMAWNSNWEQKVDCCQHGIEGNTAQQHHGGKV